MWFLFNFCSFTVFVWGLYLYVCNLYVGACHLCLCLIGSCIWVVYNYVTCVGLSDSFVWIVSMYGCLCPCVYFLSMYLLYGVVWFLQYVVYVSFLCCLFVCGCVLYVSGQCVCSFAVIGCLCICVYVNVCVWFAFILFSYVCISTGCSLCLCIIIEVSN